MVSMLFAVAVLADEPQSVAIHSRHVLDIQAGTYSDAYIVVKGERIAAIAHSAPSGARVIDLGDATVLPGFIDCHVHLLFDWTDLSATGWLRLTASQRTLWGLRNAQEYLHHGFTTLRDAGEGDLSYGQVALRDAFEKGWFDGPRLQVAGIPVSTTGGHADFDVLAPDFHLPPTPNMADTPDQVRVAARHDLKYGVDWIKLMGTGGVTDPLSDYNTTEMSEEMVRAAVETAHRAHRRVMVHAEGTEGIKTAVRGGADTIEHGTVLDDEGARLMAEHGTWLVPTLYTFQHGAEIGLSQGQEPIMLEKTKTILKAQQPAMDFAIKHHVKIAFGLDDEPRVVAKEFESLVKAGLTPLEALRAATSSAAELLQMTNDVGSLQPGHYADIIALDGDPLRDIKSTSKVVFVMKGGKVIVH